MPKSRTTIAIDDDVMRAVRVRAARSGRGDGEVIEEALRSALGFDLFTRLWERADMDAEAAIALAVEAQHESRPRRPRP